MGSQAVERLLWTNGNLATAFPSATDMLPRP